MSFVRGEQVGRLADDTERMSYTIWANFFDSHLSKLPEVLYKYREMRESCDLMIHNFFISVSFTIVKTLKPCHSYSTKLKINKK